MLQRLRSLASFPAGERRFALRALGTLAGVRLALWLLPFGALRALVERLCRAPATAPDPARARAVRRAVDRASRTIPGTACLAQALTAELLLRRDGQPARVSLGVVPNGVVPNGVVPNGVVPNGVASNGAPLDAHAWVECAGILVTGDHDDLDRYQILTVFGDGARVPLPPHLPAGVKP